MLYIYTFFYIFLTTYNTINLKYRIDLSIKIIYLIIIQIIIDNFINMAIKNLIKSRTMFKITKDNPYIFATKNDYYLLLDIFII